MEAVKAILNDSCNGIWGEKNQTAYLTTQHAETFEKKSELKSTREGEISQRLDWWHAWQHEERNIFQYFNGLISHYVVSYL